MPLKVPPPPGHISDEPDEYTSKSPDFTGAHANGRVLHVDVKWFKYGVNDKSHAASLLLSAFLLLAAMIVAIVGTFQSFTGVEAQWLNTLVTWIGNAFLFTAGIAVGKGGKASDKKETD